MRRVKKIEVIEEETREIDEDVIDRIIDGPPRWRKLSGVCRLPDGRDVKPDEVIRAYEHEIPEAFRDTFQRIDPPPLEVPTNQVVLEIKNKGLGHFDVINPLTGKAINDKPLTKDAAEALSGCLAPPDPDEEKKPEPVKEEKKPEPVKEVVEVEEIIVGEKPKPKKRGRPHKKAEVDDADIEVEEEVEVVNYDDLEDEDYE